VVVGAAGRGKENAGAGPAALTVHAVMHRTPDRNAQRIVVPQSEVRSAYQRDLLDQSREIDEILQTVRSLSELASRKKMRARNQRMGAGRGGGGGPSSEIVAWNGALEKQNMALETHLVTAQGELKATRMALQRSTDEVARLRAQLKKTEQGAAGRRRRKKRRVAGGPGGVAPRTSRWDRQQMRQTTFRADAKAREAQAVQIELLEKERDALQRELRSQQLLVHRLTSYQDG
jgi:hypothetical protein